MGHGVASTTFYDAKAHGLPYDPLKAIVAPRPIGWISAYSKNGTSSIAPYSFFNLVSDAPKIVMFASVGWKDAATNAQASGAFAANLVTANDIERMNATSAPLPTDQSEFEAFGIPETSCRMVHAPRVADAVASLECTVTQVVVPLDQDGNDAEAVIVFGQVVGYHVADWLMRDGRFDTSAAKPLSRLGYKDYSVVTDLFELARPEGAS